MENYNNLSLSVKADPDYSIKAPQIALLAQACCEGHVILLDETLTIGYVSPGYFGQLGYEQLENLTGNGVDVLNTMHPDDVVSFTMLLNFVIAHKETNAAINYRAKTFTGDFINLSGKMLVQYDVSGIFCSGIIIIYNHTHYGKIQTAALEANEKLQKLTAALPGVLYQFKMTPQGLVSFTYASGSLLPLLDYELEDLQLNGAAVFEKIHPEDKEACTSSILVSFENLSDWKRDFRIKFSNGTMKWIAANSTPTKEPDGSVIWNGFMMDITEKKEAENLSRQKDEQLKKVSESLPGIIYQFKMQPDGRVSVPYASEGFKSIYNINHEDVVNDASKIFLAVHPDDRSGMLRSILESYTTLKYWQQEFRVNFDNGHVKTISGSSIPQREADGSVLWNGFLMDITDRKAMEQQANEKARQLTRIAAQVPGIIIQFNMTPDSFISIPFANVGFEQMFGIAPENVKQDAQPFFEKVLPEVREKMMHDMLASMEAKTPWTGVYPMFNAAGEVRLMAGNAAPELEDNGSVLWTGFITDVTQQKEAEEKIRQSDARFKNMFDDHSAVMLLIEPETGKIENANYAATSYYGYSHEQLCCMNISEINTSNKQELFNLRQQTLVASPGPLVFKHRLASGEERFVEVSSSPVDYGDRKVLYAIVHDVTAKKNAEDQLKRQAIELKTSNEDLENFAHLASHDLKEPLRMVTSFLGLLQKRLGSRLEDKDRTYFNFAIDGANRMKILISDLLHYSRIGSNKENYTTVNVSELVQYNLGVLAESIGEKQAQITVHEMPVIVANPTLINELFLNLLSNAIKYTVATPPTIETGYVLMDDAWHFYVKDNGIGIKPEYYEKIFQMFQRLHSKEAYSGTGIGLALCKRIAETHHGKIWVDSEPGKGSTFWFSIPLSLQPSVVKKLPSTAL